MTTFTEEELNFLSAGIELVTAGLKEVEKERPGDRQAIEMRISCESAKHKINKMLEDNDCTCRGSVFKDSITEGLNKEFGN
jgi:hypothetical protein